MKIKVLIGISGSGKTTLANKMVNSDKNTVSVSRDKVRELLFAYTEDKIQDYFNREDYREREKLVTIQTNRIIEFHLHSGRDVILDNTHLRIQYINEIKQNFSYSEIEFILVERPLKECLEADKNRTKQVGEKLIRSQYEQLEQLKKDFDFKTYKPSKA